MRGIEFRPANPRVVHHATMRIDRTRSSRRLDEEDPKPGYAGILAPDARYPDGHFLAWTPGQLRPLAEDGLAWRLEPDSDLVLQLHLQPSGRPEFVDAAIGFYFTDRPPDRHPSILRLSRQNLDIRPGERAHVVEDRYRLPVDAELRELQPHAHLLARRFECLVEFPDGSTRPVIRIADWDFKWQDVYRLKAPLHLPAGASLVMRVTFDNSTHNVRNPSVPPRRIFWGQNTVDEMADLWIQVLTGSSEDWSLLERDIARKIALEDVVGYEGALSRDPRNAALHESVAAYYLQLGQGARAIDHLERAVRLNPRSAMSRYNLGTALLVLGRRVEAVTRFSEAIHLQPDLAYAHNSLGFALRAQGRTEEAVEHYRRALAIEPRYAHAHNNLGVALQALGRMEEAIHSYAEATRLKPSDPVPRRNWAKVLAVQGHASEAIAHLRLAVESSPEWPELLGDLRVDPRRPRRPGAQIAPGGARTRMACCRGYGQSGCTDPRRAGGRLGRHSTVRSRRRRCGCGNGAGAPARRPRAGRLHPRPSASVRGSASLLARLRFGVREITSFDHAAQGHTRVQERI